MIFEKIKKSCKDQRNTEKPTHLRLPQKKSTKLPTQIKPFFLKQREKRTLLSKRTILEQSSNSPRASLETKTSIEMLLEAIPVLVIGYYLIRRRGHVLPQCFSHVISRLLPHCLLPHCFSTQFSAFKVIIKRIKCGKNLSTSSEPVTDSF